MNTFNSVKILIPEIRGDVSGSNNFVNIKYPLTIERSELIGDNAGVGINFNLLDNNTSHSKSGGMVLSTSDIDNKNYEMDFYLRNDNTNPKYSKKITFATGSTYGSQIRLHEKIDNGSHYIGFQAPPSIGTNVIWTLPNADGSANQVLKTNGSGVLSWNPDNSSGSGGYTFFYGTITKCI